MKKIFKISAMVAGITCLVAATSACNQTICYDEATEVIAEEKAEENDLPTDIQIFKCPRGGRDGGRGPSSSPSW